MRIKNLEKASPEFQEHSVRTDLELLGLDSSQIFPEAIAQGVIWRGQREGANELRVILIRRPNSWEVLSSVPILLSTLPTASTSFQTVHGSPLASDSDHFLAVESLGPLSRALDQMQRLYPVRRTVFPHEVQDFVKGMLGGGASLPDAEAPLVLNEVRVTGWVESVLPIPDGYRMHIKLTQTGATVRVKFQSVDPGEAPIVAVGCFVYLAGELCEHDIQAYDLQVLKAV